MFFTIVVQTVFHTAVSSDLAAANGLQNNALKTIKCSSQETKGTYTLQQQIQYYCCLNFRYLRIRYLFIPSQLMEQKIVARKCLHTFRELLLISSFSSGIKGHSDLLDTLRINDRDLMPFSWWKILLPDWVGKSVKQSPVKQLS